MTDGPDPTQGGFIPPTGQLGADVIVHHVEFRLDGVIEVTVSEKHQASDQAAITKLISIHPDLIPASEVAEVLETVLDWTDLAWRHIRDQI